LSVCPHDDVRTDDQLKQKATEEKTTNPGSWMLFPAALRFSCHILFIARPPSWAASEDPVVAVPITDLADGACQRLARIETPSEEIQWSHPRTLITMRTPCVKDLWIDKKWSIIHVSHKQTRNKRVAGYSSESKREKNVNSRVLSK
jgi:hypothetical protein